MPLEPIWSQVVSIRPVGFIMSLPLLALPSSKGMRAKSRRSSSTPKEIRFYQQVSIKLPECGMHRQGKASKSYKDMKTKSFLVCLIMKETLLLQVQRIIHAKYGGTVKFIRKKSEIPQICRDCLRMI